jgi:hypothetical protein
MKISTIAEILANKAYRDIQVINNTSLAGVALTNTQQASDIESLFYLAAEQQDKIEALELKLGNYETHKHSYEDNGTNKITGVPQ